MISHYQQPVEMEDASPQEVKDLNSWIDKVSQSRPELGNFAICPYAKNSHHKIVKCPIDSLVPIDGYEVIIYIIDSSDLTTINTWVEHYNEKYPDWLFFEDCADYDTFINGVQTNNQKYNLILGQPKEKLLKFREALKKTDYYSYWSDSYYSEIVGDS
jgi:hypothetical protein